MMDRPDAKKDQNLDLELRAINAANTNVGAVQFRAQEPRIELPQTRYQDFEDVREHTRFLSPDEVRQRLRSHRPSEILGILWAILAGTLVSSSLSQQLEGTLLHASESTSETFLKLMDFYPGMSRGTFLEGGQFIEITSAQWVGVPAGLLAAGVAFGLVQLVAENRAHNNWIRSREIEYYQRPVPAQPFPFLRGEKIESSNQAGRFIAEWIKKNLTPERWLLVLYVDNRYVGGGLKDWLQAHHGFLPYTKFPPTIQRYPPNAPAPPAQTTLDYW